MITLDRPLVDPSLSGWFNHGDQILRLVEQHRPRVYVELGTWMGASAIPVARAIRRWGGTLTCVDTWLGGLDAATGVAPWMLASCAKHLLKAGVSANIRLIPATTAEAAVAWSTPIDALYIDADHSEDGCVADLRAWVPFLRPGALLLGDDYGSPLFPGVTRAWDRFEARHGLTFTRYQSDPPDPDGIQLIYGILPKELAT